MPAVAKLPVLSSWFEVGCVDEIPRLGSRVVETPGGDIAVFRGSDDAIFAVDDSCPHLGGPLSQLDPKAVVPQRPRTRQAKLELDVSLTVDLGRSQTPQRRQIDRLLSRLAVLHNDTADRPRNGGSSGHAHRERCGLVIPNDADRIHDALPDSALVREQRVHGV